MNVVKCAVMLAALGTIAFVGCDRREESAPYAQLGDEAVLVSVNGVDYTKGEFERDLAVRMDLLKLSLGEFSDAQLEERRTQFRDQAIDQFVSRELLLGEAKRRRMVLAAEEMLAYQDEFSHGLSARVPVAFGAIETVLGKRVTAFRASLRKDALSSKASARMRADIAAALPQPSKVEVERTIAGAKASNRAFAVTNRLTCALATNAWKSVLGGNDFATVGRKLHEMNGMITFIEKCDTTDETALKLAKGGVTPPLPQEKGLTIFRANGPAGEKYRFSCIFFALAPIYVIESAEETKATMFRASVDEAYAKRLESLRKAADIRYPHGRDPFRD